MATESTNQTPRMNGSAESGQHHGGRKNARPESVKEALRTLDEAIQNAGSLGDIVTDEYSHLKSALREYAPKITDEVRRYGSEAYERAADAASQGYERGRQAVDEVESRVRANLWPTIGGVALGALALGYAIGYSRSGSYGEDD